MIQLANDELLGRNVECLEEMESFFTVFNRMFAEIHIEQHPFYRLLFCYGDIQMRIRSRYDIILAQRQNKAAMFRQFEMGQMVYLSIRLKLL